MKDISEKPVVSREATASGIITLQRETLQKIQQRAIEKGDCLETARISAISAVKMTPQLIPMCHVVPVEAVSVQFALSEHGIKMSVTVRAHHKTGVEMDALSGVLIGLATIWDMVRC